MRGILRWIRFTTGHKHGKYFHVMTSSLKSRVDSDNTVSLHDIGWRSKRRSNPISSVLLFFRCFSIVATLVAYRISRSYSIGVTAAARAIDFKSSSGVFIRSKISLKRIIYERSFSSVVGNCPNFTTVVKPSHNHLFWGNTKTYLHFL